MRKGGEVGFRGLYPSGVGASLRVFTRAWQVGGDRADSYQALSFLTLSPRTRGPAHPFSGLGSGTSSTDHLGALRPWSLLGQCAASRCL